MSTSTCSASSHICYAGALALCCASDYLIRCPASPEAITLAPLMSPEVVTPPADLPETVIPAAVDQESRQEVAVSGVEEHTSIPVHSEVHTAAPAVPEVHTSVPAVSVVSAPQSLSPEVDVPLLLPPKVDVSLLLLLKVDALQLQLPEADALQPQLPEEDALQPQLPEEDALQPQLPKLTVQHGNFSPVEFASCSLLPAMEGFGDMVLCHCPQENLEIEGGHYTLTNNLERGSVLEYHCPEGYYPYPKRSRRCQLDGSWEPKPRKFPPQKCKLVECPDPNVLQAGSVFPPQSVYYVGNVTTYECYSGYTLRGSSTRVCLPNGKWDGFTPICSRDSGDHCADPGVPPGAKRRGDIFNIDEKVTYSCNKPLFLVGSEERVCQESGFWTGKEPACYYKYTYDTPEDVSEAFGSAIKDSLTTLQPVDDIESGRKIRISKSGILNIYIAVDISESINDTYVERAREAVIALIEKISSFSVSPNYEVIFFSSEIYEVVNILNFFDGRVTLSSVLNEIKSFSVGDRNTGTDLALVFTKFEERMAIIKEHPGPKGFKEHRHVLIVFTDGAYNMGGSPEPIVERIKNMVYMNQGQGPGSREEYLDIYIFGIGAEVFDNDLMRLTAGTGGRHYFRMSSSMELQRTFEEMIGFYSANLHLRPVAMDGPVMGAGINKQLMTLQVPLVAQKHMTIISTYASTLTSTEDTKDQLDQILSSISKTDKVVLKDVINCLPSRPIITEMDLAPFFDECQQVVKNLKNNKAAGPDGILVAGKVLAQIMLTWVLTSVADIVLPESQCGFRKDHSSTDMTFVLRLLQEKFREQHHDLYIGLIDLTKAFDMTESLTKNCLGSLVSPRFVLTAAHCIQGFLPRDLTVEIDDGGNKVKDVEKFWIHEKYNTQAKRSMNIKEFYDYDVALIKLRKDVEISNQVRPICIPCTNATGDALQLPSKSNCKTQEQLLLKNHLETLYFLTKSQLTRNLVDEKEVHAKLGDNRKDCINKAIGVGNITKETVNEAVTENFLCTGGQSPVRDHIACTGDSGGAVFKNFNHRTIQVALVSWGTKELCKGHGLRESDADSRDFHLNLFKVVPFLKSILGDDSQDYEPLQFLDS
ncbi:complement factor B-like [Pholidichthys leucotaenia]